MPPHHLGGRLRPDAIVGCDPVGRPNPRLVVALVRAGALGVLDLRSGDDAERLVSEVAGRTDGAFAVRTEVLDLLEGPLPSSLTTVVVPGRLAAAAAGTGLRVLAEVTDVEEGRDALAAGAAGLVGRGSEAGGRVGDTEAFVLCQQLVELGAPVWITGGIGEATAAAAMAVGAAGVVLESQLALVRECRFDTATTAAIRAMDGSETRVVDGRRVYTRPDLPETAPLGDSITSELVPLGQDTALAVALADRHVTAGGVVAAIRSSIGASVEAARTVQPLAPGNGVARTNGTRYPIAQGPMTRVSDRAEFAKAVADGGGLPFLALALLRGPEVRRLLDETTELLGDAPWGVGVLGFVPPELRAEQLEVIRDVRPPAALIAGGRPSQAAPLEADGIRTYLHAPSPGLIDSFAKAGTRRFVLEGRECGGHVGPRSSFVLWQSAVDRLAQLDDVSDLELLFAGGIHDPRSAAAVAALAAPLVERGAHAGVLMGTSYLFTEEAVAHGAITPTFQRAAVACERTKLVETAPGHATRCADSPFVAAFEDARLRLEASGATPQEVWGELETLNLGRLRIASKALVRDGDELRTVEPDEVEREGMFMLGQVATLRSEVTTIAELHESVTLGATRHLASDAAGELVAAHEVAERPGRLEVAVVGMAAVLPGAGGVDEYWANVLAGADAVTEVPAERWDVERYYDPAATTVEAGRKTPSKWGGFLDPVGFDALAYGIPPASLTAVDPVQLLSLEVAGRALADAGYATRAFDRSRASVIFGAEAGTDLSAAYGLRSVLPAFLADRAGGRALPPSLEEHLPVLTEDSFPGVLTNVIAGRIANRLDLGGVNYTVDAACAASLAALDLACKELVSGSSDLVLCGGADTHNGIHDYLLFSSVHALSPKGRCATFDADADGIALGEGVACVVLKRLEDAERDGDRVYAVIEAVAGSSDGRALGLTAPRADGQRRALERAYDMADRSPDEIELVEAHGTGTVVGDATELSTLTEVYTAHGASPGSVTLGSVKSQIGHTKCAAGLAGLIKTAQALHTGVLPPTIHLSSPNPSWEPDKSPFRFGDRPRPWTASQRRAAVSAFGFGGANFHAVLRAHDDESPLHAVDRWPAELFVVRASDRASGLERVRELAGVVAKVGEVDPEGRRHRLRDLAATVAARGAGPVQFAFVADDLAQLARQLGDVLGGCGSTEDGVFARGDDVSAEPPEITFLFPGQGSQRVAMLADLFVTFPALRRHLADDQLTDVMFPPKAFTGESRAEQREAITDTRVAQPALGVAGAAMADLLGRLGVRAAVAAGHSYGELVALAVGGAFDDETLAELSRARGEAVHRAAIRAEDPGAMVAVAASREDLQDVLARHPGVVLANHNGPRQCALSGTTPDVEAVTAELESAGVRVKRLPVACAFHSPVVASASSSLADVLATVEVQAPSIPVWSNTVAAPFPADGAGVADLLARQVASPVRFVDQVEAMYEAGSRVFVEVGPGRVLTGLVGEILGDRPHRCVATDVPGEHGVRRLLLALAELATLGVDLDTDVLFEERAETLDLGELPLPAPAWTVDGHLVRSADGEPLAGGLRPATEDPVVDLSGGPSAGLAEGTPAAVVGAYLQNLRETVAAERDVMLSFLGSDPSAFPRPAGRMDVQATAEVATSATAARRQDPDPLDPAPTGGIDLLATLSGIVGRRTGYPLDMLGPDLDLEADLSIDSIKRIEIIGELAEEVGLPGGSDGGVDEEVVEELARITTLAAIVEWLEEAGLGGGATGVDAASSPATPVGDGLDLLATLSGIVGRRTGYPLDMLGPDLDLEADLSIDSIKRIEIIGELAEEVGLPGGSDGGVDEEVVEELARLTTLAAIVEWLEEAGLGGGAAPASPVPDATPGSSATAVDGTAGTPGAGSEPGGVSVPASSLRCLVVEEPLGPPGSEPSFEGVRVALIGEGELASALRERLVAGGAEVSVGPTSAATAGADRVIHLASGGGAPAAFEDLRPALLEGSAAVTLVSPAAGSGGEPGLARALRAELAGRDVRSIRFDAHAGAVAAAEAIVAELLAAEPGDVVVGPAGRRGTAVVVDSRTGIGGPVIPAGGVVVLTGGARGITARMAERFAAEGAGHVVLVGRSPEPDGPEAPDLAAARDEVEVRKVLLSRGELKSPSEIEAALRRIVADREIRQTLAAVSSRGAGVTYVSADVRDGGAVEALLADVSSTHGRLDGVVHGAGVIEDRFVSDKELDSFRRVFDTKVLGARAILGSVPDDVGFVVLFGSVSGVFGNRGQVDYAAANDALDAMARSPRPELAGRVLSVDWGPWGGSGMVSPELAREYERRGIGLIDPEDGVAALWEELVLRHRDGTFRDAQVVVARATPSALSGELGAP